MEKDKYIYYRIFSYIFVTYVHVVPTLGMYKTLVERVPVQPELEKYLLLAPRYLTVWNVWVQIIYTSVALCCDVNAIFVLFKPESMLTKTLQAFRYNIFRSLVFPASFSIFCGFWPFFFYDREIIFPLEVDIFMSQLQNIMSHAGILVFSVLEQFWLPRDHENNRETWLITAWIFITTYFNVVLFTRFGDLGIWCYGFLTATEGNIVLYYASILTLVYILIGVFVREYVHDLIWQYRDSRLKTQ